MKLSICAIFHNQKEYVDRCLASILSQKISYSYEILLGDDNSTDGTWEKLGEYRKKYPDLISCYRINTNEFNPISKDYRSGLNRSNLYDKINGEYFSFIDGDDFILDTKRFDQQINKLEEFPQCTICAGNTAIYIDGDPPVFEKLMTENGHLRDGAIITGNEYLEKVFMHNSSMLIRKLSFDIFTRFRRELFVDYALTLFHLQFGSLVFIDKPFLAYIQQPRGIYTSLSSFEKNARSVCAIQDHLKYLPNFRKYHLRSLEDTLQYLFFFKGQRMLTEEGRAWIEHFSKKIYKLIIIKKGFLCRVLMALSMRLAVFVKRLLRKMFKIETLIIIRGFINLDTNTLK